MSQERRPMNRKLQVRVMRVINVPMRFILGLPFATPLGKRLMLISYSGRRSGKAYRQPVSYVNHEGLLLSPGGGRWTLNLREDTPVQLRRTGRDELATPELIKDPEMVEELLGVMAASNPALNRFVAIPRDADGSLNRESLRAAIDHGFRIVRWHLIPNANL